MEQQNKQPFSLLADASISNAYKDDPPKKKEGVKRIPPSPIWVLLYLPPQKPTRRTRQKKETMNTEHQSTTREKRITKEVVMVVVVLYPPDPIRFSNKNQYPTSIIPRIDFYEKTRLFVYTYQQTKGRRNNMFALRSTEAADAFEQQDNKTAAVQALREACQYELEEQFDFEQQKWLVVLFSIVGPGYESLTQDDSFQLFDEQLWQALMHQSRNSGQVSGPTYDVELKKCHGCDRIEASRGEFEECSKCLKVTQLRLSVAM